MVSIAVTGASNAVGWRLVRQLAADVAVDRVVAIDRRRVATTSPKVVPLVARLGQAEVGAGLEGCSTVVHLAPEASLGANADRVAATTATVLDQAADAGCEHVVLLSSATVYGAHADNPIPIPESMPVRDAPDHVAVPLSFAAAKLAAERVVAEWIARDGARSAAVLRPTITLSEHGAGWVAKAMRAAMIVRPDQIDPPVQFLHRDDLASALSLVARRRLDGVYNVAPDGWIGAEVFRELRGELPVRLPQPIADRARRAAGRRRPEADDAMQPYVTHPWVVSNDRLRGEGWVPAFSNEEAFVLGTPAPPWSISPQKRQEVMLGVAGAAVAGATAAAVGLARRVTR